jgi:hypothetical protein
MSFESTRRVLRRPSIDAQDQLARPGFDSARSRLVRAGLATILASLAFVASAQAGGISVNQSAIASPADPYFVLDLGQTQTVTIAGTTNVDDTDNVNIDCYRDDGASGMEVATVAANVTVTNGTFSATVPIADLNTGTGNASQLCRLRAVDTNGPAPTTGLNAFTGPRIAYSYLTGYDTYDFYLFEQQLTGADDYLSLSGCGLDESYIDDATGAYAGHGFYCNDWVTAPAASDASESGITVDGKPAYAPNTAYDANNSAAGKPHVTIDSATQNPTNGDLTLVETEPIVFCQGNPTVANVAGCATFIPAGVQDVRTFTQTDDAHVVIAHDVFSSTDGTAHDVDLLLENDQAFGTTSGVNQDYLFPGQSSWVQTSGGESETVPADSMGTIYVRNVNVPDGSESDPLGAITYFQAPSGPLAFTTHSGQGNAIFDAPDHLSVPASGSATLDYAYSTDTTADALNSDVANSKDAVIPPAVTITAPAGGTTVSITPVTVSGAASAGSGVQGLTVDGSPATVANDGSWTTSLTPVVGAQTITVTVTSQAGNTASANETFTYTPPASTTSTSTTTTTTTPAPSPAEVDQTTASRKVRGQFAVLGGSIGARAGSVTYSFQYGPTSSYGRTTKSQTLPASTDTVAVGIAARRLIPGRTYHYRLVVTHSAGQISYGTDMAVRTTRVKPRRIRDHIYAYWDQHAPYEYRLVGRMILPTGLTHAVACRTRGTVIITAVDAHKVIARHRVKVSGACTYTSTFHFTATQLRGSGRSSFSMQFGGNSQLGGRSARTLNVLYGPHKVTQ